MEEITLSSHQHPLTLSVAKYKGGIHAFCSVCGGLVLAPNGPPSYYTCSDINCWIHVHIQCAELPPEIRHPFHPQHPLTLVPHPLNGSKLQCRACGKSLQGIAYNCSSCSFNLDVRCSSLMPGNDNEIQNQNQNQRQIFNHHGCSRPLIPCDKGKNFDVSCTTCELPFQDPDLVLVCLDCSLLLHKSCAELPREIERHLFHPQHPLVLFTRTSPGEIFARCEACRKNFNGGFTYRCEKCKFILGTECAFLATRKFEFHEHPLCLIRNRPWFSCNQCGCKKCTNFLRCVPCGFNVHLHCVPTLPETVKGRCHRHALTLTLSEIKDHEDEDEDAEFYCDACEEYRYLHDPTYYCEECHFVAHVNCMVSIEEILSQGEESSVEGPLREMDIESSSKAVKAALKKQGTEAVLYSDTTDRLQN